jgi:hypothetical protein
MAVLENEQAQQEQQDEERNGTDEKHLRQARFCVGGHGAGPQEVKPILS